MNGDGVEVESGGCGIEIWAGADPEFEANSKSKARSKAAGRSARSTQAKSEATSKATSKATSRGPSVFRGVDLGRNWGVSRHRPTSRKEREKWGAFFCAAQIRLRECKQPITTHASRSPGEEGVAIAAVCCVNRAADIVGARKRPPVRPTPIPTVEIDPDGAFPPCPGIVAAWQPPPQTMPALPFVPLRATAFGPGLAVPPAPPAPGLGPRIAPNPPLPPPAKARTFDDLSVISESPPELPGNRLSLCRPVPPAPPAPTITL
jgi:hypothetical protein